MPATHVALLRGINVGGKNKLPMADLVEMFVAAGCKEVRHYIQSGNIFFSATPRVAVKVPERVTSRITESFGYRIPLVLRTVEQLAGLIAANPFLEREVAVETLHVMFLAHSPGQADVDMLDPNRSPGDEFIVRGQEVYLHLPNGGADTKLTNAYFDAKLKTVSTVRNWRTTNKLLELMIDG